MSIVQISTAFLAFGMLLTGYYAGYTWHQIGDPQPWHDFNVQVMFPIFAIGLFVAWMAWGGRPLCGDPAGAYSRSEACDENEAG